MSSQREAYQLPSQSSAGFNNNFATGYAAGDSSGGPTVQYVCGECAQKVVLGKGDAIRCSMCGHRVLYKERTKR
jgi:DNA-directed RNA polymerase I, II, and III subunit RPABC4